MRIRYYKPEDETGWLRCRVLSFLNTSYHDNVLDAKEKYENESVELVAEEEMQVIGLIDLELDSEHRRVCSDQGGFSAIIWHIAVHPDHQRRGTGNELLKAAIDIVKEKNIRRIEAYTRDDQWVNNWYKKNGFIELSSYFHIYLNSSQLKGMIKSELAKLYPEYVFAHYTGDDIELVRAKADRVYKCICYSKLL